MKFWQISVSLRFFLLMRPLPGTPEVEGSLPTRRLVLPQGRGNKALLGPGVNDSGRRTLGNRRGPPWLSATSTARLGRIYLGCA
jgi:hypothetical protein